MFELNGLISTRIKEKRETNSLWKTHDSISRKICLRNRSHRHRRAEVSEEFSTTRVITGQREFIVKSIIFRWSNNERDSEKEKKMMVQRRERKRKVRWPGPWAMKFDGYPTKQEISRQHRQ